MQSEQEHIYRIEDFSFTYPLSNYTIRWSGFHSIYEGERILLSGASGSGKSTMLYGLAGLVPEIVYGNYSGDILLRDRSILLNPESIRGKAGLILQNPSAQMLCRTVKEELAYGLENRKSDPVEIIKKITDWSERFGIRELLDRETRTLSGGEKQKTTLLSILMTKPEILMLDEPTAFLDPESAAEIISIIKNYQQNKTLIFVEHNLSYLKKIVTRNLHLNSCGEVQDRKPSEIDWNPELLHLSPSKRGCQLMEISHLSFSYTSKPLLNDVDLTLYEGEIISIRGRNGSGKSTLLGILAGLEKNFQGKILVSEKENTQKLRPYLRKITAILFQNPENHFIYNEVKEELKSCCLPEFKEEFSYKEEQSPFTLSEGEKRRLSTAVALSADKKILLLDEPTFGQDLRNKNKLISILKKLRSLRISIVIVSHDISFIKAVSSRSFLLENGKLIEDKRIGNEEV